MTAITIKYELNPPAGVKAPASGLPTTATHDFALKSSSKTTDLEAYYNSLREALAQAKNQVGAELTEWKDAVDKVEAQKEKKRVVSEEDDEDEEEDDRDA